MAEFLLSLKMLCGDETMDSFSNSTVHDRLKVSVKLLLTVLLIETFVHESNV